MSEHGSFSLLRAMPLAALIVARDETIGGANAAAQAILGDHITGRNFATVLRQPDLQAAISSALSGQDRENVRYLSRDPSGDTTFRASARWFECGNVQGALVVFEDISPLERADQMRRDFVANVSHELRTPLTALMGFIETLQGPARDDDLARGRFLGIMAQEAERMERLVSDLMSLNRVESQERLRPDQRVDLADLAGSVRRALEPLSDAAGVTLEEDLPETGLDLPGDGDQLRQLIANLIENAIKYGGSGGRVVISLTSADHDIAVRGPAAILSVRDFGQGVDPQHVSRLTERFYRVDTHRSREVGGTGLGLAIVKHIVGRHRGRLRIESTPEQGSLFTVILPLG